MGTVKESHSGAFRIYALVLPAQLALPASSLPLLPYLPSSPALSYTHRPRCRAAHVGMTLTAGF